MKGFLKIFLITLLASSIGGLFAPSRVSAAEILQSGTTQPNCTSQGYFGPVQKGTRAPIWYCYSTQTEADAVVKSGDGRTPEQVKANTESQSWAMLSWLDPTKWLTAALNTVGGFLLTIGAFILAVVGLLFDTILHWTIVEMASQVNSDGGIGKGIDAAWATLRDLANLVFIFVLLWAAIQTILELNADKFGTTIRNIIIVALLINFSLFITKFVIDAANIATIGFYNSILAGGGPGVDMPIFGKMGSMSSIFMNSIGIQTFWDAKALGGFGQGGINIMPLMLGILGLVTMLITSIVLLVAGVLFMARYIMLIFLMILSPLALIGYAIPGLSGKFKEWWDALINQAFFAPYFMLMLWVAIKLIVAVGPSLKGTGDAWGGIITSPKELIGLVVNFALVIGFIVGALILSKKMASKTQGFSALSAGVGGVAVGGAAMAGRQTIGRASNLISEKYREKLSQSAVGRSTLWLANKGKSASFDMRGVADTKLGKATGAKDLVGGIGKVGGVGGFKKAVEDQGKAKAKYAKDVYGQTEVEKALAKEAEEIEKKKKEQIDNINKELKEEKEKVGKEVRKKQKAEADEAEAEAKAAEESLNKEKTKAAEDKKIKMSLGVSEADADAAVKPLVDAAEAKLTEAKKKHVAATAKLKADIEDADYGENVTMLKAAAKVTGDQFTELKKATEAAKNVHKGRMEEYAKRIEDGPLGQMSDLKRGAVGLVGGPLGAVAAGWYGESVARKIGNMQGSKEAARKIREEAKGKSKKDQATDKIKDWLEEAGGDGKDKKKDDDGDEAGDKDKGGEEEAKAA